MWRRQEDAQLQEQRVQYAADTCELLILDRWRAARPLRMQMVAIVTEAARAAECRARLERALQHLR